MGSTMKLVRDFIPRIIEENGKVCEYHIAENEEYKEYLFEKMREELDEFIETPSVEEAGDMYEVFISILHFHEIDFVDVINVARDKKANHGGFNNKIILETVHESR
jgi:predicted house-cleaning noncanonical NTP pyrophosphatase (MazG superfamily)